MITTSYRPQFLTGRCVFEMTGVDTVRFLQNLLTQDVASLAPGQACYSALLTPQGKILADFFLYAQENSFLIDCASPQRDMLMQRLMQYKLRAAVQVRLRDDLGVVVSSDPLDQPLSYADPRLAHFGFRSFTPHTTGGYAHTPLTAGGYAPDNHSYHQARLAWGLGDSAGDIGSGILFPHEANFDFLQGVSFTKGCFTGQEIVSRMQYRGTTKQRLFPLKISGELGLGAPELTWGDHRLGLVLSHQASYGEAQDFYYGLGLIRYDRLAEAGYPLLLTGSVTVQVLKPAWMTLPWIDVTA